MRCWQCLHIGVVQRKGKHCQKPYCHGVVDTFGLKKCNHSPSQSRGLIIEYIHHAITNKFQALFWASTVDLWQAILPQWGPLHRYDALIFYSPKSWQDHCLVGITLVAELNLKLLLFGTSLFHAFTL